MPRKKEVAFVDPAVTDLSTFLAGIRPGIEVIVLETAEPVSSQIAAAMRAHNHFDVVHIVAHGTSGAVDFSAGALTLDTLSCHAERLSSIGKAAGEDPQLLLWTCRSGEGARGGAFIEALARATGAHVAAATGLVGASALGGHWSLDVGAKADGARPPLTAAGMAAYAGVMAYIPGDDFDNDLLDTAGDDLIDAFGGNDRITVTAGNDSAAGGNDNDRLVVSYAGFSGNFTSGALGGDSFSGYGGSFDTGAGASVSFSGIEHFTITTGGGNDSITTGAGDDEVDAGAGDDVVTVVGGFDNLSGGIGSDRLFVNYADSFSMVSGQASNGAGSVSSMGSVAFFSGFEHLTVTTGWGDDNIITGSGDDNIDTGEGNDNITVTGGHDVVAARGQSSFGFGTMGDILTVNYGLVSGNVTGGIDPFFIDSGSFSNGLDASVVFTGIEQFWVTTGDGDDIIATGGGTGGANDSIVTGGGSDIVTVAGGLDYVDGGAQSDRLILNYAFVFSGISGGAFGGDFAAGYSGTLSDGFNNSVNFSGIEHFTITTTDDPYLFGGNDSIMTGDGEDIINSGVGNDTITAGGGNDIVNAGSGDDTVDVGAGINQADGGQGEDGLMASLAGADTDVVVDLATNTFTTPAGTLFTNFEYLSNFWSGSGNDTVVTLGLNRNESINTGGGDDTITVAGGMDGVDGGSGTDRLIVSYMGGGGFLVGGEQGAVSGDLASGYSGFFADSGGASVLFNGIEHFTVTAFFGAQNIRTGGGDDQVMTGGGADTITVSGGIDTVATSAFTDRLIVDYGAVTGNVTGVLTGTDFDGGYSGSIGNGANDVVTFSGVEDFTITTAGGNDTLDTGTGADVVNSSGGNDTISVLGGIDTVAGGSGSDRLVVDYAAVSGNIFSTMGFSGNLTDGYSGNLDNNINTKVTFSGIEHFTVTTGGGIDEIRTGDGNDVIDTGGDDDTIVAGGGNDVVNAGAGDDRVFVDTGLDQADGGAGEDALSADMSFATSDITVDLVTNTYITPAGTSLANFEYLAFFSSGSGNDTIVTRSSNLAPVITRGNEFITTGSGDDTITFAGGEDFVHGEGGADHLILDYELAMGHITGGPFSGDLVTGYAGRFGNDIDSLSGAPGAIEAMFTGIERFTITTSHGEDAITTGDGDDVIDTGAGNDVVHAGGGNDIVTGGTGSDLLFGDAGDDTFIYDANNGPGDSIDGGEGGETLGDRLIVHGSAAAEVFNINPVSATQLGINIDIDGNDVDADIGNSEILARNVEEIEIVTGGGGDTVIVSGDLDNVGVAHSTITVTGGDGDDTFDASGVVDDEGGELVRVVLNGLGGNDTLLAGAGDDTLEVELGVSSVGGGNGSDRLVVSYGAVAGHVTGGPASGSYAAGYAGSFGNGADASVTFSGIEHFTVTTGGGNDAVTTGGGDDIIDTGTGSDSAAAGSGEDRLIVNYAGVGGVVIGGQLTGSFAAGYGGSFSNGLGSSVNYSGIEHFTVTTGAGNDVITTGGGIDAIDGGAGDDTLSGAAGVDTITGGAGNDTLNGGSGADAMAGGVGNDTYYIDGTGDVVTEVAGAGGGIDTVCSAVSYTLGADFENLVLLSGQVNTGTGNALDNVITGNNLADTLDGGAGNDRLKGGLGNDTLIGGEGHDTLIGGAGSDSMSGGAGNDVYDVDATSDTVTEEDGAGTDLVNSAAPTFTLSAHVENLVLVGAAAIDGIGNAVRNVMTGNSAGNMLSGEGGADTLNGGGGADTLNGGADDDMLDGGAGNDTLNGEAGNDVLNGGSGVDAMSGGIGNDTYYVDVSDDTITEGDDVGIDLVFSGASHVLSANVENLTLTGGAAVNGTGNEQANKITGNAAANHLAGGGGDDTLNGKGGGDEMTGGAGADTYYVDHIGDVVIEGGDPGTDTVLSGVAYTLGANVENLVLTTASARQGTGNDSNNTITGNSLDDVLNGAGGNDVLKGGLGNDTLDGGAGNDTLRAGAGNDILVYDADDMNVSGEAGDADTLRLDGAGATLDLTLVPDSRIRDVEIIDLTGTGDNGLVLRLGDVLALSSSVDQLRIDGNGGDHLTATDFADWQRQGGNPGDSYYTYINGAATLLVDIDIMTNLPT